MGEGDLWHFERFAPVYDWIVPSTDTAALEHGLAHAADPVERVLDIGGGTGRAAKAVTAPRKILLDASAAMLRQAPAGLARIRASATVLPLPNESVDAVLIVDALHHLPAVDVVLREVARVLRPGGALVVQEFDGGTFRGRLLALGERLIGMQSTFHTTDELADRIDEAGLEARIIERGFVCTVVGWKPMGEPGRP